MELKLVMILLSLLQAKRKSTTAIEETKSHIVLGTGQGSLLLLNYDTLEVENKLVLCFLIFPHESIGPTIILPMYAMFY